MGMKTVTFSGTMKNFYSKPLAELAAKDAEGNSITLPSSLPYDGKYTKYEGIEDVKAANDFPSDDEVVKFRNTQRKNNARQRAMQATVDAAGAIKPTTENDPQMRLAKMAALFMDNGLSKEEARAEASRSLKIDWDDNDDE